MSRPRRIGEVLVERGHITAEQRDEALTQQRRSGELLGEIVLGNEWATLSQVLMAAVEVSRLSHPGDRLGEVLIRRKPVTPGQFGLGLARSAASGKQLGETLIELGLITPHQLFGVLEQQQNLRSGPAA